MKLILALLIATIPSLAHADKLDLAKCQYGIMIAQKAYLSGTFDTKYPDVAHLEYLVDYWADDLMLHIDRPVAKRTVAKLAYALKSAPVRRPYEGLLYEPLQSALNAECAKYLEVE